MSYGEIGITLNEFLDPRWRKIQEGGITVGRKVLINHGLDFHGNFYWISVGALLGFTVLFDFGFILALIYLKYRDEELSLKELESAVADIGAALGLPAQGTSPDSDHIYYEVLNEFTHGKQEKVSKTEFKEVLLDILLGMAAGMKRDPIVILRMDGEDLLEFVNGPSYEAEIASIFSMIELPNNRSLCEIVIEAFGRLTVDQGIPPTSDSWVFNNILEPVLLSQGGGPYWDKPACEETFLEEFKKVALSVLIVLRSNQSLLLTVKTPLMEAASRDFYPTSLK
ncbi:hypothetical protein RIF29_14583 [Crotalaria pallida]|uniref:Plant PDR ABC transporter associated domain-containing protein n=1 Tax=Crotalaria pallida TaxID=3830 RepID=A0AAN9FKE2_CROPI